MKLEKAIVIKGIIHCETGLHIGGSSDEIEIGGVDMTVIKHPVTGEPYIPGSSLKGKMRSSIEKVKGIDSNGDPCRCGKKDCMVCTIFGPYKNTNHSLGPTRIIVRDANMNAETRQRYYNLIKDGFPFYENKTENIINRLQGNAKDPRSMERVPVGAEFGLEIILQVYDMDNEQKLIDTVKQGLIWVVKTYLGKGGSRGSGKVSLSDLTIDDKPFKLD